MKPVAQVLRIVNALLFVAIIIYGVGCAQMQYFPSKAQTLPKEQLASIILENDKASMLGGYFPIYDCPIENMSKMTGPSKAEALVYTIRAIASSTKAEATGAQPCTNPFFVAPGKYEIGIQYEARLQVTGNMYVTMTPVMATVNHKVQIIGYETAYRDGNKYYTAGNFDGDFTKRYMIQLDAKPGKKYTLRGKVTFYDNHVVPLFYFTEQ